MIPASALVKLETQMWSFPSTETAQGPKMPFQSMGGCAELFRQSVCSLRLLLYLDRVREFVGSIQNSCLRSIHP